MSPPRPWDAPPCGFNKVNQLTSKVISNALYQWHPLYTKNDAYTSNGLNQYSAVANSTLTYDANGNLTGDNVWLYIYDTENMLLGASRSGTSASYLYDPLGRRSAKSVDTVLTTFLNDGVEEIADYNSAGTLLRRYVHGPGVDEYLVMYTGMGTTNKSYFHANHQGSIVAMSDSAGNVTEQHSYDSYGNSDDLTGNPFRYTGRRLDAETGLYYYRARYYSPAIGRFLQTDPIGYGDGLNWYAYVGNDPLNGTDPSGLSCPTVSSNCIGKPKKRRTTAPSEDKDKNDDSSNAKNSDAARYIISGWVGAAAEPSPFGEVVMGTVTAGAILYYGPEMAKKLGKELEGIKKKTLGPEGIQYSLRAQNSGTYPCYNCSTGTTFLHAGDVWKYGETINPGSRYTDISLRRGGLEINGVRVN